MREAEPFPVLKIKVGLDTDEATIEAVRSVTKKPLRVDANEGWKDKEEAVRKINWLETQGVEFVEQPMPAAMLEETRWVRSRVHLPIIADEACRSARRHPQTGGRLRRHQRQAGQVRRHPGGLRMIQMAKALGMKTMLGCMISSSIGVRPPPTSRRWWTTPTWTATCSSPTIPTGRQGRKGQTDSAQSLGNRS